MGPMTICKGPTEISIDLKKTCKPRNLLSSLPVIQPKIEFTFYVSFAVISCSSSPINNSTCQYETGFSSLLVLHLILCLQGGFKFPTSPLLSLLGLFFKLSKSTCQHPIQDHIFSSCSGPLPVRLLAIKSSQVFLYCVNVKEKTDYILIIAVTDANLYDLQRRYLN